MYRCEANVVTHRSRRRWLPAAALVLAAAAALAGTTLLPMHEAEAAPAAADTTFDGERPASFADVIAAVKPAVVNISTERTASVPRFRGGPSIPPGSPFEEFFRRFFDAPGGEGPALPRMQAAGSGFIVDGSGIVVTNYHVVASAEEITVILDDGSQHLATVKGLDPKTDLAVLEIEGDGRFPSVGFGDSDGARVGDWVIAIGNPFGLGNTATTGIISARGRDIQAGPFDDFLQIDAPINSGNSGGPLFDTSGRVIGVNTAIFTPNGGNVGIGFAIPADLAAPVVDQLRTAGRVERGFLGVSIQNVDEEIAEAVGLNAAHGAMVVEVVAGSPAERAGIRVGDVILSLDGSQVEDVKELTRLAADAEVGAKSALAIWRDGRTKKLEVRIGSSPEEEIASGGRAADIQSGRLGLSLVPLDGEARRNLALADDLEGVLIAAVEPGSPAAAKGLRPGDVVVAVGSDEVRSPSALADAVNAARAKERPSVLLRIVRRGQTSFVALPLE